MRKIIIGFIVGCVLSMSATAFAAPVKQFILTKITYPILVNGVEYADEQLPALNYEGNTYIPLAKIGDLLGVDYRWNAEKKRVEIGETPDDVDVPDSQTAVESGDSLYVTDGQGAYAGFKMLHGYEGEDQYQIYFKGDANRYQTAIEDLRGINLKEIITWEYDGVTRKNTRSELYSFFADTAWFRNNLKGVTQYTLTNEWFMDVFGDVYMDWATGIGFSSDAARWVEKYFEQTGQISNTSNVTLTPDTKFEVIDEQPQAFTTEEIIERINRATEQKLADYAEQFLKEWIGADELESKHNIIVVHSDDMIELRKDSETIFSIRDVPYLIGNNIYTGNGVRYRETSGNDYLPYGLYFSREDLINAGIINE